MKRISKEYETMAQASVYQNRLYNKYDSVKLVEFPHYTEHGTYVWEVE